MVAAPSGTTNGFYLAAPFIGLAGIGLLSADIATAATGTVQTTGVLSLSDWTAATGSVTLTPGAAYYGDPTTAGMLTTTAPTTGSSQWVGVAVSETTLAINVGDLILL